MEPGRRQSQRRAVHQRCPTGAARAPDERATGEPAPRWHGAAHRQPGEWRAHLLGRLRRQVALTADPELATLYDELRAYPCDQPAPEIELPEPGAVVAPLRLRHDGRELAFFSTVATFGTPLDVTVAELVIESFFPADADTAAALRARAG